MHNDTGYLTFAQRDALTAHRDTIDALYEQWKSNRPSRADTLKLTTDGLRAYDDIGTHLRTLRLDLLAFDQIDLGRGVQQGSKLRHACDRYKRETRDRCLEVIEMRLVIASIRDHAENVRNDMLRISETLAGESYSPA